MKLLIKDHHLLPHQRSVYTYIHVSLVIVVSAFGDIMSSASNCRLPAHDSASWILHGTTTNGKTENKKQITTDNQQELLQR